MIVTVTLNPALDHTLTVPRLVFDEVLRATDTRLDWGGKGFNVSRALQTLGQASRAMGFIGGATGQTLQHGLNTLGLTTNFTSIAGETRTNTVILEAASGKYIKVNEAGPTISAEEQAAFLQRVRETVQPGDFWLFCGSLPPGVPSNFYARLIALVKERGAKAGLDTSGEALRLGCAAAPYLVKPNAHEAEEITGKTIRSDSDSADAAQFFLRQGIELAAISLGAEGLRLASKQQQVHVKPPTVTVKNPTGAGDALLAGLVWAVEQGFDMKMAARWGVAAGTTAALRAGVDFGARAEIEAAYNGLTA